jgi:hypothetical protein
MMFITASPHLESARARTHAHTHARTHTHTHTELAAPVCHPDNLASLPYTRVITNMDTHLTNLVLKYCIDYFFTLVHDVLHLSVWIDWHYQMEQRYNKELSDSVAQFLSCSVDNFIGTWMSVIDVPEILHGTLPRSVPFFSYFCEVF